MDSIIYKSVKDALRDLLQQIEAEKDPRFSLEAVNNKAVKRSLVRVCKMQGVENLCGVYPSRDSVGLRFTHIFIGIESDGYAHS